MVRSGDGRIYRTRRGHRQPQMGLPAHAAGADGAHHVGVVLYRGAVFAGFPGGRLVALALANGNVGWDATVALPKGATELERVADISSLPVTRRPADLRRRIPGAGRLFRPAQGRAAVGARYLEHFRHGDGCAQCLCVRRQERDCRVRQDHRREPVETGQVVWPQYQRPGGRPAGMSRSATTRATCIFCRATTARLSRASRPTAARSLPQPLALDDDILVQTLQRRSFRLPDRVICTSRSDGGSDAAVMRDRVSPFRRDTVP